LHIKIGRKEIMMFMWASQKMRSSWCIAKCKILFMK